jgi:hypothetical protein
MFFFFIDTGLYPFNQAEGRIRYFTGDLMEIKSNFCKIRDSSYMFKGRIRDTIYWKDSNNQIHYLLFPADISEILDDFPDVGRRSGEFVPKFWIDSKLEKYPFYIALVVELIYQPKLFSKRVNELYELIFAGLRETNKTFEYFIDQDLLDFSIEFVGPGKLTAFVIV